MLLREATLSFLSMGDWCGGVKTFPSREDPFGKAFLPMEAKLMVSKLSSLIKKRLQIMEVDPFTSTVSLAGAECVHVHY